VEAASLSAPLSAGRRLPGVQALALPGWVLLVVAVLWLRPRGVPMWDTVWAEDSTVFLQGALDQGFLAALTDPYAGYLHVPSRLLAEVAVWFAPSQWALVLALEGAVVAALLSAFVYVVSGSVLESRWARAAVAALPIFAGVGWEVPASLANLHWYGLYAVFWALIARPLGRSELVLAALVVTAVALSDPLVGLALPLALVQARSLSGPLRRRLAILVPMSAALAVQALTTLSEQGPERFSDFAAGDIAPIYGQRVIGGALLGDEWFSTLWQSLGWNAVWGALEVGVLLVAAAAWLTTGARRRVVLVAAASSVLLLVVALVLRGTAEMAPEIEALWGSRYMLTPALLLQVCLVALIDARGGTRTRAAFTALVLLVALSSFGAGTQRTAGPAWSAGLDDARTACADGATSAFVATPPDDRRPWGVRLDCSRLAGS